MAESEPYTLAMFSPHVGDKFQLEHESGAQYTLELVEALGRDNPDAQQAECFTLVFHDQAASADSYLPQAIYPLKHETLGTLEIFIVPIGPGDDGQGIRYEAVFA